MKAKLHPVLPKIASIYKDGVRELMAVQKEKLPRDRYWGRVAAIDAKTTERLANEVAPLISGTQLSALTATDLFYKGSFASLEASAQNPGDASAELEAIITPLKEFDAEHRFREPLQQIAEEHTFGKFESTKKFLRLEADWQSVRYGSGLPPFKGNIDHRILMIYGLGYGLENATADELAEFFDMFCPCESETHDADDLRKLRKSILTDARKAREAAMPKFSGTNQGTL